MVRNGYKKMKKTEKWITFRKYSKSAECHRGPT